MCREVYKWWDFTVYIYLHIYIEKRRLNVMEMKCLRIVKKGGSTKENWYYKSWLVEQSRVC